MVAAVVGEEEDERPVLSRVTPRLYLCARELPNSKDHDDGDTLSDRYPLEI